MNNVSSLNLPPLPLLLWETPPGLELILGQEGVAFARVRDPHPLAFRGGRFVLYDGRRVSAETVRATLTPEHVAIDVDLLLRQERADPFRALVDTRGALARWEVAGLSLTERVSRFPKALIRRRLIARLRQAVTRRRPLGAAGALPVPVSARPSTSGSTSTRTTSRTTSRFARARRPMADCCTHFVSTHAYGEQAGRARRPAPLRHPVARALPRHLPRSRRQPAEPGAGPRDLTESGFEPVGFAAPHGRWNPGLDAVLEDLGYLYSSDFQLGYDDLPFFPWRGRPVLERAAGPDPPDLRGALPRRGGATAGRSPATSRASSGRRWRRASRRSSTAIPSVGWAGIPRSSRPSRRP